MVSKLSLGQIVFIDVEQSKVEAQIGYQNSIAEWYADIGFNFILPLHISMAKRVVSQPGR